MASFDIIEMPASIRRSTVSSVSLMLARYPGKARVSAHRDGRLAVGLKGAQIRKLLPSLGIFLGILIHGGASKKKRLRSQGSTAFRLRGSRGLDDEIRRWDGGIQTSAC